MSTWLQGIYRNGRFYKNSLSGFWATTDDYGALNPEIPNLPLETPTGTFDTGIFDRNIFDNILGPVASGITLTADAGSYTITGTAATLRRARKVAAAAGSYAVTGTAASTKRGRKVGAAAGSYTVTGTAATLREAKKVIAAAGAYSVTGTAAALREAKKVGAEVGSYTVTGTDATLTKAGGSKTVTADAGSYALTGTAATLRHAWKVTAASGAYTVTGQDATLTKAAGTAKKITAEAGSYTITGTPATLALASNAITGGGHAWKGPVEPQYRVHPDYEDKPKKKRRKVTEPETIVLAPDITVQTGIVPVRPAWDVMAELQQRADEAERTRRAKLRAIALADDDWLMVA